MKPLQRLCAETGSHHPPQPVLQGSSYMLCHNRCRRAAHVSLDMNTSILPEVTKLVYCRAALPAAQMTCRKILVSFGPHRPG